MPSSLLGLGAFPLYIRSTFSSCASPRSAGLAPAASLEVRTTTALPRAARAVRREFDFPVGRSAPSHLLPPTEPRLSSEFHPYNFCASPVGGTFWGCWRAERPSLKKSSVFGVTKNKRVRRQYERPIPGSMPERTLRALKAPLIHPTKVRLIEKAQDNKGWRIKSRCDMVGFKQPRSGWLQDRECFKMSPCKTWTALNTNCVFIIKGCLVVRR